VKVPAGVDDAEVRSQLLRKYNIEISGGLGHLKGKIWRIGTMGYSATHSNIRLLLSALEDILEDLGHRVDKGSCTDAAEEVYESYDADSALTARAFAEIPDSGTGETIAAESVARGVAHKDA
jgi:hypothetical protein